MIINHLIIQPIMDERKRKARTFAWEGITIATSFLLRNLQGDTVGYVLMLDRSLCVKVNGLEENARMTVFHAEGADEIQVAGDAKECQLSWDKGDIHAVCVRCSDVLFAAGGEHALELYEQFCGAKGKKEKNIENECKTDVDSNVYTHREKIGEERRERRQPYLRWPPPPCWPSARYVDGLWTDGEEG